MAVTLLRAYQGFASGAIVSFPDTTESALVAQGLATQNATPVDSWPAITPIGYATIGGNFGPVLASGVSAPTVPQGPRILPNGPILAFASLGSNTTLVAGTVYTCEIQVAHIAQWTGIGVLNGATVGTNNGLVALYDSAGNLITTSAVAGAVTAGANTFQNRNFLSAPVLVPGRYFLSYQANGTTDTLRTWAAANGGNQMTQSIVGTFGTVPAITPPTTFTTDVGPIARLFV